MIIGLLIGVGGGGSGYVSVVGLVVISQNGIVVVIIWVSLVDVRVHVMKT